LNLVLLAAMACPIVLLAQQDVNAPQGKFTASTDVGAALHGATTYDAPTGTYRIAGSGADMWGAADAFHFSWLQLAGDAALTADVHFPAEVTGPLEKAVLIMRQSLAPGSPYADTAIHADGHITLQYRIAPDGKTDDVTSTEHKSVRLRIERKGNVFTAYNSTADGKMTPFASIAIPMSGPIYIGLGVCSHAPGQLATVMFSSVTIERPAAAR
jgi:hypothetical protein